MTSKTERKRLIKGISLCPKCYEKGKRSLLIYDNLLNKIFYDEREHKWELDAWLKEIRHNG